MATSSPIHKSPYSVSIPAVDIPSYVFASGTPSSRESPQYFDANNPSRHFSLSEAEIIVKRFSRGLQAKGIQRGDRVLLYSANQLFFPVVIWAVNAAGGIFTAASPSSTVGELEYQLRDSGAKILLTGVDGADVAMKVGSNAGLTMNDVYLFHDPIESHTTIPLRPWMDLWVAEKDVVNWTWRPISSTEEAQSTTAVINYSSGTTGLPKGVELSHWNLVANTEQVIFKRGLTAHTPAGQARRRRLNRSGERWLAVLPMYHAFGQTYFSLTAPRLGAKVFIVTNKFSISRYLLYLDIYRITFMNAVPTIYTLISKEANPAKYNLKAVENVTNGSAPLDPAIGAAVAQKYYHEHTKVKQGWGMTETTCSVTGFAMDDEDDGRSIGWLHPNCYAKIVPIPDRDFSSASSAKETIGEIWVAGPNIMKGYWKKDKETEDTLCYEDGIRWMKTGDIGYIDKRGCIYIVGRLKELIKVKGLQVAPVELEVALSTHPGVLDAAVVGANINGNEYVRAFIVRKSESVTADELFDFIKQRFAAHKWLTGGVYFINKIPRTGSGKVIKRQLPSVKDEVRARL